MIEAFAHSLRGVDDSPPTVEIGVQFVARGGPNSSGVKRQAVINSGIYY